MIVLWLVGCGGATSGLGLGGVVATRASAGDARSKRITTRRLADNLEHREDFSVSRTGTNERLSGLKDSSSSGHVQRVGVCRTVTACPPQRSDQRAIKPGVKRLLELYGNSSTVFVPATTRWPTPGAALRTDT